MRNLLLKMAIIPTLLGLTTTASAQWGYPYNYGYPYDCGYSSGCGYPVDCGSNCCSSNSFDGFYIGGNVGFASYHHQLTSLNGFFNVETSLYRTHSFEDRNTSWAAGLQVGYDWLCCNKLVGIVWDWDWTGAKTRTDSRTYPITGLPIVDHTIKGEIKWFSTIRARAGVVLCDSLVYVTAGAAVADFKLRLVERFPANTTGIFDTTRSFHRHRWGWTAGFGAEWALWCNWTMNAEILFLAFDSKNLSTTPRTSSDLTRVDFKVNDDVWVGRIGLNYRFSLCNWFW